MQLDFGASAAGVELCRNLTALPMEHFGFQRGSVVVDKFTSNNNLLPMEDFVEGWGESELREEEKKRK